MDKEFYINHFIASHSVWCHAAATNLTGNKELAQDLVQDTLVTILTLSDERFEKLRFGEHDLNAFFFYTTMKNRFINQVKKNKEDNVEGQAAIFSQIEDKPSEEERELKAQHLSNLIEQELKRMEQDPELWFSAVLFSTYMKEGISMEALSKRIDISKSTVFTTIRNTKAYLRDKFINEYNDLLS